MERRKSFYVRLTEQVHEALEKIAKEEGRTKQEIAREAIAEYVRKWKKREKEKQS